LTYKAKDNAITMVEPFTMDAPKTKELIKILDNLKANGRKTLVVLPENSNNIYLSSRNLPEVKVITVDEINTYTLINANHLVMVDGVQDILVERRK
jgi:large subunit ribosomal protein L4